MAQEDYKDRQFLAVIGDEVRSSYISLYIVDTSLIHLLTVLTPTTGLSHWPSARWHRGALSQYVTLIILLIDSNHGLSI